MPSTPPGLRPTCPGCGQDTQWISLGTTTLRAGDANLVTNVPLVLEACGNCGFVRMTDPDFRRG